MRFARVSSRPEIQSILQNFIIVSLLFVAAAIFVVARVTNKGVPFNLCPRSPRNEFANDDNHSDSQYHQRQDFPHVFTSCKEPRGMTFLPLPGDLKLRGSYVNLFGFIR